MASLFYLNNMQFVVLDIETTGLDPITDRITEIAIIITDDFKEVSRYTTLVNPGIPVPRQITSLTGISGQMVEQAPAFGDIAPEIKKLLGTLPLVGHHVGFDYAFLKYAFRMNGISYSAKTICTAELARFILPSQRSFSLRALCAKFNIVNHRPHRALYDTDAATKVFCKLVDLCGIPIFNRWMQDKLKLKNDAFGNLRKLAGELPPVTGIYYFMGKWNKPLYVGKAGNIKSRVAGHFRGESNSIKLLAAAPEIRSVKFTETGSKLLAALLEDHEIRRYWPVYNNAQKNFNKRFGIVAYRDMNNQWRLAIAQSGKLYLFIAWFHQYHKAVAFLKKLVETYQFHEPLVGTGYSSELSTIDHNRNFELMLNQIANYRNISIYLVEGRNVHEQGFVWVENFVYRGFGFINSKEEHSFENFESRLQKCFSSITIENILEKLTDNRQPDHVFKVHKKAPSAIWSQEAFLQI